MPQVNTSMSILYGGVVDKMVEINVNNSVFVPMKPSGVSGWVDIWFKTSVGNGTLFGLQQGGAGRFQKYLRLIGSGFVSFVFERNSSVVVNSDAAIYADNNWHHALGVAQGNTLFLFVDNILQTTSAVVTGNSLANIPNFVAGGIGGGSFYTGLMTQGHTGIAHTGTKEALAVKLFNGGVPPDVLSLTGIGLTSNFEFPGLTPPVATLDLGLENGNTQGDFTSIFGLTIADAVLDFPSIGVAAPTRTLFGTLIQPLVPRLITKL